MSSPSAPASDKLDREILAVASVVVLGAIMSILDVTVVNVAINTHWHFDHTMGNGTYAEAFPGLSIVAHIETARQSAGYNPGWFARFPRRADRFRQTLEAGKDNNGKVLTEGDRKEYSEAIAGTAAVQEEFKSIVDRSPNLTFDSELRLDLGNREVQIKWLGRGNTAGDGARHGCCGMLGGEDGQPHDYRLVSKTSGERRLKTKEVGIVIAPGDVLKVRSGGGGGWGDPAKRSAAAHRRDLEQGLVTSSGAR